MNLLASKKGSNRGLLIYAAVALSLILALFIIMSLNSSQTKGATYSEIMGYFDNFQVEEFTIDLGTGELKMKVEGKEKKIEYVVPNVSLFVGEIMNDSFNYRQEYDKLHPDRPLKMDMYPIKDTSWLATLIPYLLMLGVMVALFVFMMRSAGGGGKINNFGKANVKNQNKNGRKTTFADVAGAEEEKMEMAEIVDFLKNPKKYCDIGARIPKGVLLLGPPGTGKTLLAKAVAGEAGCPFFSISGSDFVEMFVGVGASRVRDLFEQAKKNSPSIIFIDEIDAVGRHRGAGLGGGHDEREQTLNQLLVEMDGFETNEGVIVIAATNRRDILDPALLRPGRFDREIVVNYPDVKGREAILKVHSKNKPLAPDVDLKVIAKTTQYFTGADLENLLNEAALLAARANRKAITEADIEEATMKVIAGPEKKSALVTDRDRRITAYHEAGHAVAAYYLETCEKVHQVTVIQRGMAAGLTVTRPVKDDLHVTKRALYERIVMTLGGRVSESIFCDDISTGASGDIEQATKTARAMVTKYGFSEKLGTVLYGSDQGEVFLGRDYGHTQDYSETVAAEIDSEIRRIISEAYEACEELLNTHKQDVIDVAEYLIKYEKIDSDDFDKLLRGELIPKAENKESAEAPTENNADDTPSEITNMDGSSDSADNTDE